VLRRPTVRGAQRGTVRDADASQQQGPQRALTRGKGPRLPPRFARDQRRYAVDEFRLDFAALFPCRTESGRQCEARNEGRSAMPMRASSRARNGHSRAARRSLDPSTPLTSFVWTLPPCFPAAPSPAGAMSGAGATNRSGRVSVLLVPLRRGRHLLGAETRLAAFWHDGPDQATRVEGKIARRVVPGIRAEGPVEAHRDEPDDAHQERRNLGVPTLVTREPWWQPWSLFVEVVTFWAPRPVLRHFGMTRVRPGR
jgi:hypothetical protein